MAKSRVGLQECITRSDWAYLAGLIDGEGNVGVYRHKNNKDGKYLYQAKIIITNTSAELIAWLLNNIGGSFWARGQRRAAWKQTYSWYPNSADVLTVCKNVLPYLVVKREQILLLMEFPFDAFGQKGTLSNSKEVKQRLYERTLVLNKVGSERPVGDNG